MVGDNNTADSSRLLNHPQKKPHCRTNFYRSSSFFAPLKNCQLSPEFIVSKVPRKSLSFSHCSLSTSCFRPFKFDILSCAFVIVLVLAQAEVTSSATSSPPSSSSNLQLNIGILVAESCNGTFIDKIRKTADQAIDYFKAYVERTEGQATPLHISCTTYPFCDTRRVVSSLDEIFGNDTIHAVLGLSTYDVHTSFIPLAEIFKKAYIPVNTYIFTLAKTQSVSFAPKFSQRGLMLAKVLDTYKWQNLYIIFTNFNLWLNFATYMYFEMTLFEFKVRLASAVISPVTPEDAIMVLKKVGSAKEHGATNQLTNFAGSQHPITCHLEAVGFYGNVFGKMRLPVCCVIPC